MNWAINSIAIKWFRLIIFLIISFSIFVTLP